MPQVKNDPTDKSAESVVLAHDNVWIDDVHYQGKKGETIKVSPSTAKTLREYNLVEKD